jgi:predicted nucleic acid binding AN1-type Zn finger protein
MSTHYTSASMALSVGRVCVAFCASECAEIASTSAASNLHFESELFMVNEIVAYTDENIQTQNAVQVPLEDPKQVSLLLLCNKSPGFV